MTRHIYLRHHIYASLGSIRHDVSHVVLRIEAAILLRSVLRCPYLRLRQQQVGHILLSGISHTERVLIVEVSPCSLYGQQRITLHLHSPSLVVRKMPVKAVELIVSHHVNELLQLVNGIEMSRAVDHQSAPSISRTVADINLRQHHLLSLYHGQQLSQCGNGVYHSRISRTRHGDSTTLHLQRVSALFTILCEAKTDVATLRNHLQLRSGLSLESVREVLRRRHKRRIVHFNRGFGTKHNGAFLLIYVIWLRDNRYVLSDSHR